MRRNLEQAVSSLPNQWPPLTPCLSLQGSARSPTRPVPARPVTACLMMMLTTHCLPLQPNLGPIGKWFSVHSYSRWKVRGIFILVCIPASIWSFESLRPFKIYVSIGSRSSVNVKFKLTSLRIFCSMSFFFFFLIYLLSLHYCFISPVNQKPNLQSPCSRMKRRRTCSPQNQPANLQQRWVRWTD